MISIPTVASITLELQLIPPRIVLTENPVASEQHLTDLPRNHGAQLATLTNAVVNAVGIEAKVREINPGRYYSVLVSIPNGFKLENGQKAELTLETTHSRFPRLTVPIAPFHP